MWRMLLDSFNYTATAILRTAIAILLMCSDLLTLSTHIILREFTPHAAASS